jgi:hypothetical protein
MLENHDSEQFFWDEPTVQHLADVAARFEWPCALCTPFLGVELEKRAFPARVLDSDERFSGVAGFEPYDLRRPRFLNEDFGAIFCDPPFWNVSLRELLSAIRVLSRYDSGQKLAICFPTRRSAALLRVFAEFELQPSGYFPKYRTVKNIARNEIEFFANFEW